MTVMASGEPSLTSNSGNSEQPAQSVGSGWSDFFKAIGIADDKGATYSNIFQQNDITRELLGDLSDSDLKDLGIDSFGHRKLLLKHGSDGRSADAAAPGYVGTVQTAFGPYTQRAVKQNKPDKAHKAFLKMQQHEAEMQQRQQEQMYKQWKKGKKLHKQYQQYGGYNQPPQDPNYAYSVATPPMYPAQPPPQQQYSGAGEYYQPQGAYPVYREQRKQKAAPPQYYR